MSPFFPQPTRSYIAAFQFSSWYPPFANSGLTIKSTIIRPLDAAFIEYLNADGVLVPEGSEDWVAESTLSDDESDEESDEEPTQRYAFPSLDAQIRACIKQYEAVFPKLNFSSPKDATWILPSSSPFKCVTPADVYLLLKSSDFITHDLDSAALFEGVEDEEGETAPYELELVLRKWYAIDPSREMRCFVRDNVLFAISQRDTNFYPYMLEVKTQDTMRTSIQAFWSEHIKTRWEGIGTYTFDLLLTRNLSKAHILDFNSYATRTDSLLFTYEELDELFDETQTSTPALPRLRIVSSPSSCAVPANQHNMVPFDALSLSNGRNIEEFAEAWREGVRESAAIDSDSD